MMSSRAVVETMIRACNARDTESACACFAEDAVYHNIPLEAVQGVARIREVLGGFLNMASEVDWQVHHWAENADGVVMTERTDRFLINGSWLEIPVMGCFEVRDGRIQAWRDYFDMAPLAALMGG